MQIKTDNMADVMKNIRRHDLALSIVIFNHLWHDSVLQKSRLIFYSLHSSRICM